LDQQKIKNFNLISQPNTLVIFHEISKAADGYKEIGNKVLSRVMPLSSQFLFEDFQRRLDTKYKVLSVIRFFFANFDDKENFTIYHKLSCKFSTIFNSDMLINK
jgi:hypothetical protein